MLLLNHRSQYQEFTLDLSRTCAQATIGEDLGLDPASVEVLLTRWKTAAAVPGGIAAAYYCGVRADGTRTKHLVISLMFLAHLALFATALAQTAWEFLGTRVAFAAASAGLRTVLPVLATHAVHPRNYSIAIAAVMLSHGVGEAIGETAVLFSRPGPELWRACFFTISAIGFVCTAALARWLVEVARIEDLGPCPPVAPGCTLRNTFLLVSGFLGTIPPVANGLLLSRFGAHQQQQQRAAWTENDTVGQVACWVVGSALGVLLGGFVGRGMHAARALPWQGGLCWLACSLAGVCALDAMLVGDTGHCALTLAGAALGGIVTPNLHAALVMHNPERRGAVAGVLAMCTTSAGLLASLVGSHLAFAYGEGCALFVLNMAWLTSGFFFYLATLVDDAAL